MMTKYEQMESQYNQEKENNKILSTLIEKYSDKVALYENLLEKAVEELENCYGKETILTEEIRKTLNC